MKRLSLSGALVIAACGALPAQNRTPTPPPTFDASQSRSAPKAADTTHKSAGILQPFHYHKGIRGYHMTLFPFRRRDFLFLLAAPFLLLWDVGFPAQAGQNAVETESAKGWVGKKAKGFVLPGVDGKPVDIGKNLGKRPVVLVFYRGVW